MSLRQAWPEIFVQRPGNRFFSCPDSPPKFIESTTEKLFCISPPLHPTTHIIKIKVTKLLITQDHLLNYLLDVNTTYE